MTQKLLVFFKIILFVQLLFLNTDVFSQNYTRQQVTDDLNYLKSRMELFHPNIQLYNPDFKIKADSVLKMVRDKMSRLEFFQLVSRMIALGNEGHYNVGLWSDSVHIGFTGNTYKYLPLSAYVLDGHIYVKNNVSNNTTLREGDEIHSINGTSATTIIERFKQFLPIDGYIPSALENRLTNGFNWLYYLYIDQPDTFEIVYTPYQVESQRTITIDALTRDQQFENLKFYIGEDLPSGPPSESKIDDFYIYEIKENTGWLKLKSFHWELVDKFKIDAKKLYASIFKDLKEKSIKKLVVDLRNNTGGRSEFAYEILPFILKRKVEGPYGNSLSWRGKKKEFKMPRMSKDAFQGEIYVLVNARTFSSAAAMARFFREYGDAVVIGNETSTRYEGFAAGSKQAIDLPNLQIRIGIPRYLTNYPPSLKQPTSNRGLIPDHIIKYSIEDKIRKVDKELEVLEQLLNQN